MVESKQSNGLADEQFRQPLYEKKKITKLVLNELGQALKEEFEADMADYGCSCHISPPCGYCMHPGNPDNLEETPEAWENIPEE